MKSEIFKNEHCSGNFGDKDVYSNQCFTLRPETCDLRRSQITESVCGESGL